MEKRGSGGEKREGGKGERYFGIISSYPDPTKSDN